MDRVVVSIAVAAAGLAGLIYAWTAGDVPEPLPVVPVSVSATSSIFVHVSGAVVSPGVVEVAPNSRVAEAVAAAGGATTEAVLTAINLAATVSDGEQVIVPSVLSESGVVASGDGKIAINRVDAQSLEELPGVGPVLAGRIVAFRDQNGPFSVVEDLLDVPGIGEAKLASLRDYIRVP